MCAGATHGVLGNTGTSSDGERRGVADVALGFGWRWVILGDGLLIVDFTIQVGHGARPASFPDNNMAIASPRTCAARIRFPLSNAPRITQL